MRAVLSKPPLVYVLAQITISPIQAMANYIPDIQENLRKDFPGYEEIQATEIQLTAGSMPVLSPFTQWHFTNQSRTLGILIQHNALTIHSSKYDSFVQLSNSFSDAIRKINAILKIGFYSRIGLRYINFIPQSIDKYINKQLLGFRVNPGNNSEDIFFTRTETVQQTIHGTLKIQTVHAHKNSIQNHEKICIPPDLMPIAGYLNLQNDESTSPYFVILDIDHFMMNNDSNFDAKEIFIKLENLHKEIYSTFREAVTDIAISDWS